MGKGMTQPEFSTIPLCSGMSPRWLWTWTVRREILFLSALSNGFHYSNIPIGKWNGKRQQC